MSFSPPSVPDQLPSPRGAVNLGSNNPFRNRAASPITLSDSSSEKPGASTRPLSTNPFLDETAPLSPLLAPERAMSPKKNPVIDPEVTEQAAEIFEKLSLENKPKSSGRRPAPQRSENLLPNMTDGKASHRPIHPPLKGQCESENNGKPRAHPSGDVFADPQDPSKLRESRRPRRNSDSSVRDPTARPLDPEEERLRKERRRRERESRYREGRSRSKRGPSYRLDVIDKLDVTSIFGTGLFHHDGPFDACNPHRNRKGVRSAPMQAFPKDSRNMALGGAGPNNTNIDLNLFHGRGDEGYADYSSTGDSMRKASHIAGFDPTSRVEPIHGAESMGLGTSTFLEGAPASRVAIQRRQSENEGHGMSNTGGLQRKKSLAQKIRGINNRSTSGRVTSTDPAMTSVLKPESPTQPSSSRKPNDKNPFFQDYDEAYEKKGAKIQQVAESVKTDKIPTTRPRSTESTQPAPEAEKTASNEPSTTFDRDAEAKTAAGTGAGGGGFINRVKSLRRPKVDKKMTTSTT